MNKFWMIVFHTMLWSSVAASLLGPDGLAMPAAIVAALSLAGIASTHCDILEKRIAQLEKDA